MLLTIIAPEVLTGKALADLISACQTLHRMILFEEVKTGNIAWTLAHSFFADMGGFEIHFALGTPLAIGPDERDEFGPDTKEKTENREFLAEVAESCKSVHCAAGKSPWREDAINTKAVLSSFEFCKATDLKVPHLIHLWAENAGMLQGSIWILDANQLRAARSYGIIEYLPDIQNEAISDRSKSDALIKFLALLQILWLIIQLIARRIRSLPSSQLEVVTVAYAACSAVTYFILLSKPQSVGVPFVVYASRYPTSQEIVGIAAEGPFSWNWIRGGCWLPNHAFHYSGPKWRYFWAQLLGTGIGGALFGIVHLLAWNFSFPTPVERLLWRVSAILTTTVPIVAELSFADLSKGKLELWLDIHIYDGCLSWLWWKFLQVLALIYVLARLFVLIEAFRTLYFLPPKTFLTTWAANMPSLS